MSLCINHRPAGSARRRAYVRFGAALLATIGTIALLAGCVNAGPNPSSPNASSGASGVSGNLTIVDTIYPPTLDPQNTTNSSTNKVVRPMYDTLVAYTPGTGPELVGELATAWTESSDQTSYTFTLREGITFHSGNPFSAADVVYTLNRIKSIGTGIAVNIEPFESAIAVSPTEVKVTLSTSYRPFLGALVRVYILDSKLMTENAGDDNGQAYLADHDAGSGPYMLAENVSTTSTSFKYFPDYWKGWDGKHFETAKFKYEPEGATQQADLTAGTADIALGLPREAYETLGPDLTVVASDSLEGLYAHMNYRSGIMENPTARKAIAAAFDYETFSKNIMVGYSSVAKGPLSSQMACFSPSTDVPTFSLDTAKKLAEQAGIVGKTVNILYLPHLADEVQGFQLLQSALNKIGVNAVAQPTAWPAYTELLKSPETTPDIAFSYAYPLFPDPNEVLNINYNSAFVGATNYGGYTNATVDQLLTTARGQSITDSCATYKKVVTQIVADSPSLWISDNKYVIAMSSGVKGYDYNVSQHKSIDIYSLSK